jgi:hypothetical protein
MPSVDIEVITEATTHDLISLDDLKIMLDIPASDVSNDPQLQMLIEQNSEAIAMECNRVFAKEEVEELWQCVAIECCPDGASRIWLSHYPVDMSLPITVESPVGTLLDPSAYRIEKWSGKLTITAGVSSEVLVHYTGGYVLPDEAPGPLQQVAGLMVRSFRTEAAAASTSGSGVRMLAHKDSRVIYFSPKDMAGGGTTTSTGPSIQTSAVKNLLSKYTRYFI